MARKINIGDIFGRLVVIDTEQRKRNQPASLCKCKCGDIKIITNSDLRSNRVNSCGCLKRELITINNTTHNLKTHRLYSIYNNMKSRCYNSKLKSYKNYGARGIKICDDWLTDFMNFYNWAIDNGYKEGLTLDRIDVNGNYEPSNCRWTTSKVQCNNTRSNVMITIGNDTKTLSNWCEVYNINYKTVRDRIKRNWTIERALSEPVNIKFRNKKGSDANV